MLPYATSMKRSASLFVFLLTFFVQAMAQTESLASPDVVSGGFTYGEFKAGYGVTQFRSGLEEKFENGNFGTSGGGLFSVAAYRKFAKVDHLHFGLKFKSLGASPSEGDGGDEMFFNFWGASFSTKYFPFSKTGSQGLYIQADYNFVTQFTQKYRNTQALEFDHQFAIGRSFTAGMGYQHRLKNRYALVASVEYDRASRRGEVQGIGDVRFRNGNLAFQLGLIF
jgi:hypothetical protein